MKLLVVGAGIGDLAAGVAFEQAGHEAVIVERATGNTAAGRKILTRSGRELGKGPWQGGVIRRTDLHDALHGRLHTTVRPGRHGQPRRIRKERWAEMRRRAIAGAP